MRGRRRRHLQAVLFLTVLATLPYVPFLDGFFLADDLMLDYFLLEDGELSGSKMAYHFFPRDGYVKREIYRPMDFVQLAADWTFWRTNPFGYHLSNLVLHTWCTILVYFLIRRLGPRGGQRFPAVFGGMLFALHPLCPEAVQWIVGRVDLTSCFFTLLTLLCFMVYRQRGGAGYLVCALAALVLALLSKETAIFVPTYLVLYDLCATRRAGPKLPPHALAFGLVAAYFGLRYACFGSFLGKYESAGDEMAASLAERWPTGLAEVGHVIQEMFVPLRESAFAPSEAGALWFCLLFGYGAIVGVAVSRGLIRGESPSRAAIFAGLWLAATLAPLAKLLLLLPLSGDHLNGRLAYLPLAAFCTAFPLFLFGTDSWKERVWVRIRFGAAGLLPIVFIPITVTHNEQFAIAGESVESLRDRVLEIHALVPEDTPVIIENPPREMVGVYTLRTGLGFLFSPPFSPREIPVVGLNLTTPDEFGRFMAAHARAPLILHWRQETMRVQDHTRGYSGALPSWRGEALRTLRVSGTAESKTTADALTASRAAAPARIRVESPPIHVPTGVLHALSADFTVGAGAAGIPVFVLHGIDANGERRAIELPAGPAVGPERESERESDGGAVRVRIVATRNRFAAYAGGQGADAIPIKRFERVSLACPAGWERVTLHALSCHRAVPEIALEGPAARTRFPVDGPAPPFAFRALDGVRYYRLVLDIPELGRQTARFDAWALNGGTPVAAGEIVRKPLSGGNLDASDFSFDLTALGDAFRGSDFEFRWCIEAIADPVTPWLIQARSAWRVGLIH